MILTPFGYKLPDLGDKDWWSQLYYNIVRGSGHTHNGVDSPMLTSANFTKTSQNLSFTNWTAGTLGDLKQTVVMPTGMNFTHFAPQFFIDGGADDGMPVFLDYRKVSNTSYELYTNNPNLSLRVLYV